MDNFKEHRCFTCRRLLFKYSIVLGKRDLFNIEAKCSRCGGKKVFEIDLESLLKMYEELKEKNS